jgi:nucleoside-diphosphate-sugar epimerase
MKIGITGITGLIGSRVAALARERGHQIIGFSRHPERGGPGWRRLTRDQTPDVSGCDAILNLAGESVIGIWTPAKKRMIRESRVMATRNIVNAILDAPEPPRVLVNGSAIGFYGDTGDEPAGRMRGLGTRGIAARGDRDARGAFAHRSGARAGGRGPCRNASDLPPRPGREAGERPPVDVLGPHRR